MKVLHLTLKKEPFEVMKTGEKPEEFRKWSKWIMSRLQTEFGLKKHYDAVKFVNGYGSSRPSFTAEYKGFDWAEKDYIKVYSNGLEVHGTKGDIIIKLGKIIN